MPLAILIALVAAAPAAAADFIPVIHANPSQIALRGDPGPWGAVCWHGFAAARAALAKAGVNIGGQFGRTPCTAPTTVTIRTAAEPASGTKTAHVVSLIESNSCCLRRRS